MKEHAYLTTEQLTVLQARLVARNFRCRRYLRNLIVRGIRGRRIAFQSPAPDSLEVVMRLLALRLFAVGILVAAYQVNHGLGIAALTCGFGYVGAKRWRHSPDRHMDVSGT